MRNNLLLCLVVCLVGCASSGKEISTDRVAQIQKGVTTEAEVIQMLGTPQTKTIGSDGKVIMLYQYTKVKNRAANFVPVVGLLAGGMDMRMQMFTVIVNQQGIVENYTLNDSNTDINSGLLNV